MSKKIAVSLTQLGFRESEQDVYLYLLSHGPSSVSTIARGTRLHRPKTYSALAALEDKGLVVETPKGKLKAYHAEKPEKLRQLVADVAANLEETLPDLEDLYTEHSTKPSVQMTQGRHAVTAAFSDVVHSLSPGDTFYRYTSEKNLAKVNSYLPAEYRTLRDEKKLERLVISNVTSGSQKKPRLERFIKYISPKESLFEQNIIELMYGNKVAFIDLSTETVLTIENQAFADFQKTIFKTLYKRL